MAQVVNGRLQTPEGAPKSLIFDLPSSMLNGTKQELRIQPYGNSSYTSSGQIIRFVIPKTDRAFANFQTGYLTGQMVFANLPGTAGSDTFNVIGSYYSFFSRQVISSNGKVLETLERPAELVNATVNSTISYADRAALGTAWGFNSTGSSLVGEPINTSATVSVTNFTGNNATMTFAIPLIGLLNAQRQLPLVNGDITIDLTVNSVSNFLAGNSATAVTAVGSAATVTFTMSNLYYVVDQLTLTPESYAKVMMNYPQSLYIKSESYDFGSASLASGASGAIDIPVSIKRSSAKKVLIYFSDSRGTDKSFGAVNPDGSDLQFITNGVGYPMRPLNLTNPADIFMQSQKAFGSIYSAAHSGFMNRYDFCRRMDANTLYCSSVQSSADNDNYGNKFYIWIDLETVNFDQESLYSGIPMGVNSNFRLNTAAQLPAAATCYYWICYDAIIEMDLINGITNVIA